MEGLSAARQPRRRLRRPSADAPLALPDKPSIAVLPFQNMSGDPEQEYFADGMVEDIITALSRFKSLFVIARNSIFTYKGKSPSTSGRSAANSAFAMCSKAACARLATGSASPASSSMPLAALTYLGGPLRRRAGGRVRFPGRGDATGSSAAIAPRVEQAEIERATRKPPSNLTPTTASCGRG